MLSKTMPLRFRTAILRRPCPEMIHGLTTAGLGLPDFSEAWRQHEAYADALRRCGLAVHILGQDSAHPDSVFIEDVAICTSRFAVITRPGAKSRLGETSRMVDVMSQYFTDIVEIRAPGTLEGGDVMMAGNHFFIGQSARTNAEGARQLIRMLEDRGMTGSVVPLKEVLHLKTGVSYLENNSLLVCGEFVTHPAFKSFNRIVVPKEEAYAANSVWVNDRVMVPRGFPITLGKIREAGFQTLELDVSQFRKLDGGLSCLSLRF